MQSVTNIFDQLRLSPPIPGPLHKRTVDAADLGTTAEVLAAAKALSHAFFREQKTSHAHRPKICHATRPNEAKHVPDSQDEGLI